MKSRSTAQGSRSSATKLADKVAAKSPKSSHKKLFANRTPIKLRASTGKCVAKRTRDKSPKASVSSSHKNVSSPSDKVRSPNVKIQTTEKSHTLAKPKSADEVPAVSKKATLKKHRNTIGKSQKIEKRNSKKETTKQANPDSFLDLWALTSIGKREASLNASMKVNIIFERHSPSKYPKTPVKKSDVAIPETTCDENTIDKTCGKVKVSELIKSGRKITNESVKEPNQTDSDVSLAQVKSPEKPEKSKSKLVDQSSKKRKSPGYKIFKEERTAKARKIDKKSSIKAKNKIVKRARKNVPSGHQLCNIIEKRPRQASLIAKAMIALEQEDDTVPELAARTKIYDWMELRSQTQTDSRRIRWFSGLGNIIKGKKIKINEGIQSVKEDETTAADVDSQGDPSASMVESESLHNTLLRTLHQIGDSRLLKEYLRAQKEDFPGFVDIEKFSTPERKKLPTPEPPKKHLSPPAVDEKPDKEVEKPVTCSPIKPQPYCVATPVPQFAMTQRSNFLRHPVAQPIYPAQHAHGNPQPVKVTPYTPSPAYIYQYAMDRPQGALYASASPSPLPYGVSSNDAAHRDYTSTFTLSHMGSLGLGRRGVNPFQAASYSAPLHLPMQQIGLNYSAYYPTSFQPLPQQNVPTMQTVPLHQQYPLVQALPQHQVPQDMSPLDTYDYPPHLPNMGQDSSCMPPPPLPPAHRPTPLAAQPPMRQPISMSHHSAPPVPPLESLRPVNPVQNIARSPALELPPNFLHHQGNPHEQLPVFSSCRPHQILAREHTREHPGSSHYKYSVTCNGLNKSFSPCKKEHDDVSAYDCDLINKTSMCNSECLPRSLGSSRTNPESSNVSDLLHSAHSTMYQIDGLNSMENIREFHHPQPPSSDNSVGNGSPSKLSVFGQSSFSASYSVSSILDMPTCKVKSEPEQKMCAVYDVPVVLSRVEHRILEQPQSAFVCFAAMESDKKSGSKQADTTPPSNMQKTDDTATQNGSGSSAQTVKHEDISDEKRSKSVIVIDDTDGSSDDEPLARLVKVKSSDDSDALSVESVVSDVHKKPSILSKTNTLSPHIPAQQPKISVKMKDRLKEKVAEQQIKQPETMKDKKVTTSKIHNPGSSKRVLFKPQQEATSSEAPVKSQSSTQEDDGKVNSEPESKIKCVTKKTTLGNNPKAKKSGKKVKDPPVWPTTPVKVNTNHGWSWIGEGQMKPIPKITQSREEVVRIRKCYQSMRHISGEIVSVRDCVILQSDGDSSIPFVAKVSALWENLNGEMMFSMLWYYQPEHTATGREPDDGEQELFASKHREENSVACIDDKCYVLMYNEYCRLEAEGARQEQGVPLPRWRELMPEVTDDDKKLCRPLPPATTCADNIWFCRYDYDVRKKVVKKPKHKKSNLRYRAPCKLVS